MGHHQRGEKPAAWKAEEIHALIDTFTKGAKNLLR